MEIINDDNFVELNKFYSMYSSMDRRKLENALIRSMILRNKRFESIQNKILGDLYNRLINKKIRVVVLFSVEPDQSPSGRL